MYLSKDYQSMLEPGEQDSLDYESMNTIKDLEDWEHATYDATTDVLAKIEEAQHN